MNTCQNSVKIPFGKHKGKLLTELNTSADAQYLHWIYPKCKGKLKIAIKEYLNIKE